jgi:glyoxylase-like metal-dependent hydrolase (beta-lactamase superfamily II)
MAQEILKGIYKIEIPMPGNPLRALNSYLIKGKKRHLLIDTGFNWPVCKEAQLKGIAALGIKWEDIDFFITHLHGDHSGLVYDLASKKAKVYCSKTDAGLIKACIDPAYWEMDDAVYIQNGYPREVLKKQGHNINAYISGTDIDFTYIQHGDVLEIGDYHLTCIETPGHTPGHMCLYEPEYKFLISGDHILDGITSNITCWRGVEDSLGNYLSSLDKVKAMDVKLVLPGHRAIIHNPQIRIDELKLHHEARLEEILGILVAMPMTGYQVASRMHWQLTYDSWGQFPSYQKWFATGEAIAHLEHLASLGKVKCIQKGEVLFYDLNASKQKVMGA